MLATKLLIPWLILLGSSMLDSVSASGDGGSSNLGDTNGSRNLKQGSNSNSNWIDPDTPPSAFRTEMYTQHAITMPPTSPPTPKPTRRHRRQHTSEPTYLPTESISPSPSTPAESHPSEAPSSPPSSTPGAYELVFSDEFNTPGRTFHDGFDPRWTALDKNDYTNDALHYYSPDNAFTNDKGELVITTEAADTDVVGFDDVNRKNTHVTKHFKSAMLQSWNKFCFTGGIIEAEVTLPGKGDVGGLWPAFWMLGNLARHTYVGSSEHIWPWSSTVCTKKSQTAQEINACKNVLHYGFLEHTGRGAPEVDIFEVQPGNIKHNTGVFLESSVGQPFMSASYQIAPGRPYNRPGPGYWPGPGQWYEGLRGGENTSLNILFYGNYNHFLNDVNPFAQDYWSDAISYNRQLNEDHFEHPHVYRLEWDVPVPSEQKDGYLRWYLDGKLVLSIDGKGIRKAGLGSSITSEPSYILLNTAVSSQWGFPTECPNSCTCENYNCRSESWQDRCGFSEGFCEMVLDEQGPPQYKINYIRVYQNPNNPEQKVGCSTPERPTRRYIEGHKESYKQKTDRVMLKDVQIGRGTCDPSRQNTSITDACGGPTHGTCTRGRVCECRDGYVGPHCLSPHGNDPIVYDAPSKITDIGFMLPLVFPKVLVICGLFFVVVFLFSLLSVKRLRQRQRDIIDGALMSLQKTRRKNDSNYGSMNASI